jgi:hypothetical protein
VQVVLDLQAGSLNTWGSGPPAGDGILDSERFSTVLSLPGQYKLTISSASGGGLSECY